MGCWVHCSCFVLFQTSMSWGGPYLNNFLSQTAGVNKLICCVSGPWMSFTWFSQTPTIDSSARWCLHGSQSSTKTIWRSGANLFPTVAASMSTKVSLVVQTSSLYGYSVWLGSWRHSYYSFPIYFILSRLNCLLYWEPQFKCYCVSRWVTLDFGQPQPFLAVTFATNKSPGPFYWPEGCVHDIWNLNSYLKGNFQKLL